MPFPVHLATLLFLPLLTFYGYTHTRLVTLRFPFYPRILPLWFCCRAAALRFLLPFAVGHAVTVCDARLRLVVRLPYVWLWFLPILVWIGCQFAFATYTRSAFCLYTLPARLRYARPRLPFAYGYHGLRFTTPPHTAYGSSSVYLCGYLYHGYLPIVTFGLRLHTHYRLCTLLLPFVTPHITFTVMPGSPRTLLYNILLPRTRLVNVVTYTPRSHTVGLFYCRFTLAFQCRLRVRDYRLPFTPHALHYRYTPRLVALVGFLLVPPFPGLRATPHTHGWLRLCLVVYSACVLRLHFAVGL